MIFIWEICLPCTQPLLWAQRGDVHSVHQGYTSGILRPVALREIHRRTLSLSSLKGPIRSTNQWDWAHIPSIPKARLAQSLPPAKKRETSRLIRGGHSPTSRTRWTRGQSDVLPLRVRIHRVRLSRQNSFVPRQRVAATRQTGRPAKGAEKRFVNDGLKLLVGLLVCWIVISVTMVPFGWMNGYT